MTEHLGSGKHDPAGRGSGNSRNGTRAKAVLIEVGPVEIEVPRDTNSGSEPQIVKKRQRRPTKPQITRLSTATDRFWQSSAIAESRFRDSPQTRL